MSFLAKGHANKHANKGYDHVWLTVQWVDIRFQRKKLSCCSRSWWCEKWLSLNPTAIQVGKKNDRSAFNRPALPVIVMSVLRSQEEQRELPTAFSGISTQPQLITTDPEAAPKSMLLHNLRRNGSGPPCGQQETEHQCSLFFYVWRTTHYTACMSLPMAMVTQITVSSPYLPLNQTSWPGYFSHALILDSVRILQSSGKQSMCPIFLYPTPFSHFLQECHAPLTGIILSISWWISTV